MVPLTIATSLIFDLDGTLWIHFGLFFFLLFVLNRLMYKPYLALRERRISETKDKVLLADVYRTGARKLQKECEQILDKARREAHADRLRTREKAVKASERMKAEIDRESDRMLYDNEVRLDAEVHESRKVLKKQVPELARLLALRLLGRK